MIRFIAWMLNKEVYETCKSCQTLRDQLVSVNAQNRELTETLLKLIKPEVIHTNPPTIVAPAQHAATFAERRRILETANARKADVIKRSPFIAKPDAAKSEVKKELNITTATAGATPDISALEKELEIASEEGEGTNG